MAYPDNPEVAYSYSFQIYALVHSFAKLGHFKNAKYFFLFFKTHYISAFLSLRFDSGEPLWLSRLGQI